MATAYSAEPPAAPLIVRSPDQLPDLYAMTGSGTCMEPLIANGTCMAFSKSGQPQPGDIVVVWFKPEHARPGEAQCFLKRLVFALPPESHISFPLPGETPLAPIVLVEQINPPRRYAIPGTHVLAVHRCIGPAEPQGGGRATVQMSKEGR